MSSTSTTQYYGLTQYVGTDKPDFTDNNVAFRDVDAALHGVVQDAEGFATDITNLQTDVAAAQSAITTLQTDLDTAEAAIVTINNKDLAQDAEIARVDTNSKDMITAYNEASATSTHAYAIGDYFIYNNVLYKATAAIAIGDTIVPDSNCTTTNVTSELIQLNNDLADKQTKAFTKVQKSATLDTPAGVVLATTDYNEAIVAITSGANPTYVFSWAITAAMINDLAATSPDKVYRSGFYNSASDYAACDFTVNANALYNAHMSINGNNVTDLTMTVYYR